MFCSRCGGRNDEDAKFCEKCGADLGAMPRPSVVGAPPAAAPSPPPVMAAPVTPPYAYPPAHRHTWWYPIGVWVILSGFFAFIDVTATRTITWSVWPIGILGIFMVGIPLLNLLEEKSTRR